MTSPAWRTLLADAWAKSGAGDRSGEPIATHTWQVLSRFAQLARRHPHLPDLVGDPRLWQRAFWACWLHDLGKLAPGFQTYIRTGKRWDHRHEVFSLMFLPWVADPADPDHAWIAAGIASHHKDAAAIVGDDRVITGAQGRYDPSCPADDLDLTRWVSDLREDWIRGIAAWLQAAPDEWIAKLGLTGQIDVPSQLPAEVDPAALRRQGPDLILAGLQAYRSLWRDLQAEPAGSPRNRAAVALRGLILMADHLGSAHAPALAPLELPDRDRLTAVLELSELRSHQRAAAESGGSILFAAPTGSGKTEAALLWARQQVDKRPGSSLIYVLPFQASINAMAERLARLSGGKVALLHARSAQVLYRDLVENKGYHAQAADRAARRSDDLARLHQPAIWVATPYQLLRAAYRLRGYEAIWTALAGSLIVLDEVHAYDADRLGLLIGLIAELRRTWGVAVCSMSATMPSWPRRLLQEHVELKLLPTDPELFAAFRRHTIELLEGDLLSPHVIGHIAGRCHGGESLLVAANTVRTAQAAYDALRDALGEDRVILLHSRFTGRDRLTKEAEVRRRLAAGQPFVAVATQVIEVSLDLDFDGLVTEPAPLEALAQRFGRVNRRGRQGIVPVTVLTEPRDGQGVYDDRLVARCLDLLLTHAGEVVDEAHLTDWLDAIYEGGLAEEWGERVNQKLALFRGGAIETLRAFETSPLLEDEFDRLFDGTEVLPVSLQGEYECRRAESVLAAGELLVPVTEWQERALHDRLKWHREWSLRIADLPYDSERGLRAPNEAVS